MRASAPLQILVTLAFCLLTFAETTYAQDLRQAEAALSRGDFTQAHKLAQRSIESGVHTAAQLVPAYRVLAVASARLGDLDAARLAFISALGLAPSFRLEGDNSAEVRSPYMEARGFWSVYDKPLSVSVTIADSKTALVAEVSDPAHLSVRVLVRARTDRQEAFVEMVTPSTDRLVLPFKGLHAGQLEYVVALLDEYGNRDRKSVV